MKIQIEPYINVNEKAMLLGCDIPKDITILPRNFEDAKLIDEFIYESSTPEIRLLLKEAHISETGIDNKGAKRVYAQEKSIEWIGPLIYVSAECILTNPYVIPIIEGVIANYVTEWLRGIPESKGVKLGIVVEKEENREFIKIDFEGSPSELHHLSDIIREARK